MRVLLIIGGVIVGMMIISFVAAMAGHYCSMIPGGIFLVFAGLYWVFKDYKGGPGGGGGRGDPSDTSGP